MPLLVYRYQLRTPVDHVEGAEGCVALEVTIAGLTFLGDVEVEVLVPDVPAGEVLRLE
jgi:hypothetical protein